MKPCQETAPGIYESLPVAIEDDEVLAQGPNFAAASFPIPANAKRPVELTVGAATPVIVRLTPAVPLARWIGALRVTITDATGAKIVTDLVQIDGVTEFRWPIGLAPGTYSFAFEAMGDGKATTTATIGTAPQQLDVALTK